MPRGSIAFPKYGMLNYRALLEDIERQIISEQMLVEKKKKRRKKKSTPISGVYGWIGYPIDFSGGDGGGD